MQFTLSSRQRRSELTVCDSSRSCAMKSDAMGQSSKASLLERVAAYYTDKIRQHGPTPQGVDWRDLESQEMRFACLLRIVDDDPGASLIELGCGYGALYGYLRR